MFVTFCMDCFTVSGVAPLDSRRTTARFVISGRHFYGLPTLADVAFHSRRIAQNKGVIRNVTSDNATCAYHRPPSYGHPATNGAVRADTSATSN